MKRLFFGLILSVVFLCCLSFAAAESEAEDHPIPVEIRSLTVGDKASLEFANTGDSDLLLVTFRFRGWDAEGKIVNIFEAAEAGTLPENMDTVMLLDVTCVPFVQPGGTDTVDLSAGYEAVRAARLEAAVQKYTLMDGTAWQVPESQLVWFSSVGGYPEGSSNTFSYRYPLPDVFKKSYTFSLGVTVARIYPEFEDYFEISHAGYGVAAVRHGLFSNAGVLEDDLLWAFNGVSLEEDPYALEKAKAALVDGEAMVLSVQRDGKEISITLPPEVMLTPP